MKAKRDPKIRVNICWEVKDEKKCVTLSKDEAYATKDWVEKEGGCVWWFVPLED